MVFAFGTIPFITSFKDLRRWKTWQTSVKFHFLRLSFSFGLFTNSIKVLELIEWEIISFSFFKSGVNFTVIWLEAFIFENFDNGSLILNFDLLLELNFDTAVSSLDFLSHTKDYFKRSFLEHFLFVILILLTSPIQERFPALTVVISFGIKELQNSEVKLKACYSLCFVENYW